MDLFAENFVERSGGKMSLYHHIEVAEKTNHQNDSLDSRSKSVLEKCVEFSARKMSGGFFRLSRTGQNEGNPLDFRYQRTALVTESDALRKSGSYFRGLRAGNFPLRRVRQYDYLPPYTPYMDGENESFRVVNP